MGALATGYLDAARASGLTLDGDAGVLQHVFGVLQPGNPGFNIVEPRTREPGQYGKAATIMADHDPITGTRLRTPRSAAVAGIVFSLLLGLALVLITVSSPADPAEVGAWLTQSPHRGTIAVALNLVPFAGIAFLWFIGVVRDRIGQREDRFFASVFLGSGLLFVAMLFAAAAFAGGLIADVALRSGAAPGAAVLALGRHVTGLLLNTYAMRMAAVFTLSTATITLRAQIIPRWIGILGWGVAAVLLVSVSLTPWVELLFPAWILLLSIDILRTGLRAPSAAPSVEPKRKPRDGK